MCPDSMSSNVRRIRPPLARVGKQSIKLRSQRGWVKKKNKINTQRNLIGTELGRKRPTKKRKINILFLEAHEPIQKERKEKEMADLPTVKRRDGSVTAMPGGRSTVVVKSPLHALDIIMRRSGFLVLFCPAT